MTATPWTKRLASRTQRLSLAVLTAGDAEAVQALTNHPSITSSISFMHYPFTVSAAASLIEMNESGRDCFLGIRRLADGELVGVIGSHLVDQADIEIGYWIGVRFQANGYASEAARGLIEMLRAVLPERRIFAECHPDNRSSWSLLAKLGFHSTGQLGARAGRSMLVLGDAESAASSKA